MSAVTWLPIPGHDGYEAGDNGQIRSWRRYSNGQVLTPTLDRNGYYKQRVRTAAASQWVHRLIALAFHGPCPDGMEVRHLDGNPLNNTPANLTYGTSSENKRDQVRHGTHAEASKTHCPEGHPYDEQNTLRRSGGGRLCRICRKRVKAASYRRSVARRAAA